MWSRFRKKKEERVYLARAPRVHLNSLIHTEFTRRTPEPAKQMELSNISLTGLALTADSKADRVRVGNFIFGDLVLGGAPAISVKLEVMRSMGSMLGCRFNEPTSELRSRILKYFEVEIASGEFLPVPAGRLAQEKDGQPAWFTGENNCELYLVTSGTKVVRFHLGLFANYVEGGEDLPLRFGKIVEDPIPEKPGHKGSSLIRPDENWGKEQLVMALRLVRQAAQLNPEHRKRLEELLNASE
ncbi:MAG: hypothetical protein A2X94_01335 [Bdellovibrionales bacterium GWB1_55_8]|nr:MAG: hypothetical protein A2X94_01335 [Bdellovibrionales bacterium GWB1_55_8]